MWNAKKNENVEENEQKQHRALNNNAIDVRLMFYSFYFQINIQNGEKWFWQKQRQREIDKLHTIKIAYS